MQQKERVKRAFIGNMNNFQWSKDQIIQNTEQNRGTKVLESPVNRNQVSAMDEKGDETVISIADQFHLVQDQNFTKYKQKRGFILWKTQSGKGILKTLESNVSANEVSAIDITRKVELLRAIQSILCTTNNEKEVLSPSEDNLSENEVSVINRKSRK